MSHRDKIRNEFSRVAGSFDKRTRGRFDHMKVAEFSRVQPGSTVIEVGAGTGHFLSQFAEAAATLIGVDLTPEMLLRRPKGMLAVVGDGIAIPFRSDSIDLVACAQMLHHVWEPVEILREMGRVAKPDGGVLVVDQVATEDPAEAAALTELEVIRDPSHAVSRPPSKMRELLQSAGLTVVDERIATSADRFLRWTPADEFPEERIRATREFLAKRGAETGLGFEADGDDFTFARRRVMLLARP